MKTKPLTQKLDRKEFSTFGRKCLSFTNACMILAGIGTLSAVRAGDDDGSNTLNIETIATTQVADVDAKEPDAGRKEEPVTETLPPSTRFDLNDINDDRYVLAGRLIIHRQFMGTAATPSYRDHVQFQCFNGQELKFSSFTDDELEARISKLLLNGRSLPAVVTVSFKRVRVGHDGINVEERLMAHIEKCERTNAKSICAAAEAAGFNTADSERFKSTLDPDLVKDGIAVSLGKIYVRSKNAPQGSSLAISGVRVFNTTSEDAVIEIIGLEIEQEGISQQCKWSVRSQAPHSWQLKAEGWSDGAYEEGKMPRLLWMFDPSAPIEPEKKVKLKLGLKLNRGETLILTRTVDPI